MLRDMVKPRHAKVQTINVKKNKISKEKSIETFSIIIHVCCMMFDDFTDRQMSILFLLPSTHFVCLYLIFLKYHYHFLLFFNYYYSFYFYFCFFVLLYSFMLLSRYYKKQIDCDADKFLNIT